MCCECRQNNHYSCCARLALPEKKNTKQTTNAYDYNSRGCFIIITIFSRECDTESVLLALLIKANETREKNKTTKTIKKKFTLFTQLMNVHTSLLYASVARAFSLNVYTCEATVTAGVYFIFGLDH